MCGIHGRLTISARPANRPMPPVIASEQRTARLSPALSWRPRACPTRTVAARAKLSGIMKISEVKLSAI